MTHALDIGRCHAPRHIAYDDECDGCGNEFVFRQPQNESELDALLTAVTSTIGPFGRDGDLHWTPERVRDWWRNRGEVREYALAVARKWGDPTYSPRHRGHYDDAAEGLVEYVAYINDGLESYLRDSMFWLDNRRSAKTGDALPLL